MVVAEILILGAFVDCSIFLWMSKHWSKNQYYVPDVDIKCLAKCISNKFEAYPNASTRGKEMHERAWWCKNVCLSVCRDFRYKVANKTI